MANKINTQYVVLFNQQLELTVTTHVGPRVLSLKYRNGKNLFFEHKNTAVKKNKWEIYGGHRFWLAPESLKYTYHPDNSPVKYEVVNNGVVFKDLKSGIKDVYKQLQIVVDPVKPVVTLTHTLVNKSKKTQQVIPWGLTAFKKGAKAIIPLSPEGKHPNDLLPSDNLVLWPYTNLIDKRFAFNDRTISLKQAKGSPQKIGINASKNWIACVIDQCIFVKVVKPEVNELYPDLNSRFEVFTNENMLELESLAPVKTIPGNKSVSLTETWLLLPLAASKDVDKFIERELKKYKLI